MKISIQTKNGSVLLAALLSCAVLGGALASYLVLVRVQNASVMHSQSWNSAIPISEAGIEEALAHINDSQIGTNFAVDGWVRTNEASMGPAFFLKRSIGEGRYEVWI